jgi:putative nucleotidyltransferase with HDIG domain
MNREKALELLKEYIRSDNLIKHSLASEVVMIALAKRLHEDEIKWGLAGLLHDIDVEITNADPYKHGIECIKILKNANIDDEIIDAISMHNEIASGKERTSIFQHALAAGETITGLIMATTLVYPDKKISSVKTKSIIKRMKEKSFAASVKRENILECELIGIPLSEFAELSLNAMCTISDELGL